MEREKARKILITGASGYIGGRLLNTLIEKEVAVRCMARNPQLLKARIGGKAEIVKGDAFNTSSLINALSGIDTAYYFIHSLAGTEDFHEQDKIAAKNFREAASAAGVKKIIYLGGLGKEPGLSKHLASSKHNPAYRVACLNRDWVGEPFFRNGESACRKTPNHDNAPVGADSCATDSDRRYHDLSPKGP